MKLIISENQYRRLLERKNSKTIIVTESQYNKLINEQFSPLRVPYEVRSKLTPILKSLLLSVSVIYMNNKLKGGVKEVDLENENVKLTVIDTELCGCPRKIIDGKRYKENGFYCIQVDTIWKKKIFHS